MFNNQQNLPKLKVVWICRVSDPDLNDRLKPLKRTPQVSPWITHTAELISECKELELHVISPHEYISGIKKIYRKGVNYYFFNNNIPIWGRHWPGFFKWDVWTEYAQSKKIVKRLVNTIKPDVIHLQGAENPYYSATIIQFLGVYPVFVNLQRMTLDFYRGPSKMALMGVKVEQQILMSFKHLGIRTKKMKDDILAYNPRAITHFVRFCIPELSPHPSKKEYDLVFFSQISKVKGIEDLIKCMAIIKLHISDIKLCIMGSSSKGYLKSLQDLATELHVADNIIWKGFIPSLHEVHIEASKAKVSVLPTHYDIIPGAIIESMQLGLPVVSYKAGSIPDLNEDQETVLLVEVGDIDGLAKNIIRLLNDQSLYQTLSKRGIERIKAKHNNEQVINQHLECYHEVISDFQGQRKQ